MRDEAGDQRDVTVAVVTMGKPDEAAAFCRSERLPFLCLADPARQAYRAYGLRRGSMTDVLGPASVMAGLRAAAKGHFPSVPVGDVYQLGGLFLIEQSGRVRYAYYPRDSGDHPPAGEIARVVARAGAVEHRADAAEPPPAR